MSLIVPRCASRGQQAPIHKLAGKYAVPQSWLFNAAAIDRRFSITSSRSATGLGGVGFTTTGAAGCKIDRDNRIATDWVSHIAVFRLSSASATENILSREDDPVGSGPCLGITTGFAFAGGSNNYRIWYGYGAPNVLIGRQVSFDVEAGKLYSFAGRMNRDGSSTFTATNGISSSASLYYKTGTIAGWRSTSTIGIDSGSSTSGNLAILLLAEIPMRLPDHELVELSLNPWKILDFDSVEDPLFFGSAAERRRNRLALAMM